jgi:hypothetical protein
VYIPFKNQKISKIDDDIFLANSYFDIKKPAKRELKAGLT